MGPRYISSGQEKGAIRWDAPLKDLDDIQKLTHPTIEVDEVATQRTFDAVSEVFSDILPVHIYCALPHANLIGEATHLRGIEQVMMDMYDNSRWLHELMDFIAQGLMKRVKYLEDNGHLTLNNRGHYNDSGGIGFSDELPAPDFDGKALHEVSAERSEHVRRRDLWGFGVAQELAWVSPAQHEEFVLNYQSM